MSTPIVHPRLAQACFEAAIAPMRRNPQDYAKLGVKLVRYGFPYLDIELDWHRFQSTLHMRVEATNYCYRPIRGWWINASGDTLLPGQGVMPINAGFHPSRADGTPGGWFCFAGWQDYHNHSSHQDLAWAAIRNDPGFSVPALIMRIHNEVNSEQVQRA